MEVGATLHEVEVQLARQEGTSQAICKEKEEQIKLNTLYLLQTSYSKAAALHALC